MELFWQAVTGVLLIMTAGVLLVCGPARGTAAAGPTRTIGRTRRGESPIAAAPDLSRVRKRAG